MDTLFFMSFDNFESDIAYEERVFKPWRLFIMDSGEIIEKLAEVRIRIREWEPETVCCFYVRNKCSSG